MTRWNLQWKQKFLNRVFDRSVLVVKGDRS